MLKKEKMLLEAKELNKALKSRKIKEDVASELIQPGLAILNAVEAAKDVLPPLDVDFEDIMADIDINALPSQDDLDDETGVEGSVDIKESLARGEVVLNEASPNEQVVRDFYEDSHGSNLSYGDYQDWCATSGRTPISGQVFRRLIKKITADAEGNAGAPAEEEIPVEPYQMSNQLASLVAACEQGADAVDDAVTTVREKYKTISLKLKRVITGTSQKNYYLLFGDAGIGKSKTVTKCLKACGYNNVPVIKGDIGKSKTDVAMFLWQHKDDELVVLDDCDTMIDVRGADAAVMNMLKGAMDPDGHTVTISPTIQKVLNNRFKSDDNVPANLRTGVYKVSRDGEIACMDEGSVMFFDPADVEDAGLSPMTFNSKNDALDFCKEDGEEDSVYEIIDPHGNSVMMYDASTQSTSADGEELDTRAEVPNTWQFNCRVIFISNLDTPRVNPAILSRCDYYCLHLTEEEYMVRLGEIINDMEIDGERSGWTPEQIKEAKAFSVSIMASAIEAAHHGIKLFGKRVIITHPLEFRIVKDLIEGYLMLIDDDLEEHPEHTRAEAQQATLQSFVRLFLLPKL